MIALEGRSAIIHYLRRGRVYVATEAMVTGPAITFTGQLRQQDLCGSRRYPTRTYTLPLKDCEIRWLDQDGGAR